MSNYSENNKRIARNTLMLYFRMIFLMILGLFTSRIVIDLLGIENYGIYNVVGGLVALVSYLNNALSSSTMRFISFSIGKNDDISLIFNTSLRIHLMMAFGILILAETIGLWFLCNEMVIPEDRFIPALSVFQISVFTTVLVILALPYSAFIIAYEKLNVFAYFAIADAIFKLMMIGVLYFLPFDRLIEYSIMMAFIQLCYTLAYYIYCNKHFTETKICKKYDKRLSREMVSFAGWSLFGCTASIANTQGVNMLLNVFGGPVLNAARGISVQIQGIVNNFAVNFQTAVNPQIVKYYAGREFDYLHELMIRSAKISFYLMLIICLPIIMEVNQLLYWWLGKVPEYTSIFMILILVITIIDSLSYPLMKSADASGKIRRYHTLIGGFLLLVLPTDYFFLKSGYPPYSVFVIQIGFSLVALFLRLLIVRELVKIRVRDYLFRGVFPAFSVGILATIISLSVKFTLLSLPFIGRFFITECSCIITTLTLIWFIGFNRSEKQFVLSQIMRVLQKWKR